MLKIYLQLHKYEDNKNDDLNIRILKVIVGCWRQIKIIL